MDQLEARQYLLERSIQIGYDDPRSAEEIAELHQATGSTAISAALERDTDTDVGTHAAIDKLNRIGKSGERLPYLAV